MKHYCSTDTKVIAVSLLEEGYSPQEIAHRFQVGVSTFYRWKRRTEFGLPLDSKPIHKREAVKKEHCIISLKQIIGENKDLYLREIKVKLKKMTGLNVSVSSIYYWLKELGISFKKNGSSNEAKKRRTQKTT